MSETQLINQLKFKISSLQSQLSDKQKSLQQYQTIQSQSDLKIKALSKMHADKIKTLLNSIQILKKQKANIQGLSKQHKRSKLIQQLNKQISDQDLAIQVLRKLIYDKQGKQKGRQICDDIIVKTLTKGPQRIRPLSRQQLRIQIDRLKSINITLQSRLKNGGKLSQGIKNKNQAKLINNNIQQLSDISSISQQSFINQNSQIFQKLRLLQFENQNMKLQLNAKLKIIQKLKLQLLQTDQLKTNYQLLQNQVAIANKKVTTYQNLMKQSKQHTNTKIIQLYQREIKVQQLQLVSKQNRQKLKQAQQYHTILQQQYRLQKQQLQTQLNTLKQQNNQLILDNINQKKKIDQFKKIIKDLDDTHSQQKQDMKSRITTFESQIERIVKDNKKYNDAYRNAQTALFQAKAQWTEKQNKLLDELRMVQKNKGGSQLFSKHLQDIQTLTKQNKQLRQLVQDGGHGSSNDKALLSRMSTYEQKIKFLQSIKNLPQDQKFKKLYVQYNTLLKKYNDLFEQFENYKQRYGPKSKQLHRKQQIQLTQQQKSQYELMSSGLTSLNLKQINQDILDNFDSSFEYQFIINNKGQTVKMPKLTSTDRQLLKLMTSDLWDFVTDDKVQKNIQKAVQLVSQDEQSPINYQQIKKLRKLSNPQGKSIQLYQQQTPRLNQISDSVSVTSAMDKQLNKFDSNVNIQFKKYPTGTNSKPLAFNKLSDISLSVDGSESISNVEIGQSNILKKKKIDKISRINLKNSSNFYKSSITSQQLNSDVSSIGIRQSQLQMISSDIDTDFKKKNAIKKY